MGGGEVGRWGGRVDLKYNRIKRFIAHKLTVLKLRPQDKAGAAVVGGLIDVLGGENRIRTKSALCGLSVAGIVCWTLSGGGCASGIIKVA